MKAKLIKVLDQYHLYDGDKAIATTIVGNPMLLPNLSKQNCDEIFGVVDVEKLAEEITKEYATLTPKAFKRGVALGINKAMELNKDKVFTLGDMKKAFELGYDASADTYMTERKEKEFEILIQQPTEIEVKIVMEYVGKCNGNNDNGCFQDSSGHNCGCFNKQPKIDSENCLTLRKI